MGSRLVFTDGEGWRLRSLLLPELRRSGCRHSIADFVAGPKSASEKFEVAFAVVADRGRTRGRRVTYVAGSTPGRRSLHTLEPPSTALIGCLRTVGSALAATATVGAVAQHWPS